MLPIRIKRCLVTVVMVLVITISGFPSIRPLQAGVWDNIKERILQFHLSGGGGFVSYERHVDTKDKNFPLEIVGDGYKMTRVYQELPGFYMVEWTWKVQLKNKSDHEVNFSLEYKLQDEDALLVAASEASAGKIAPGESVVVEKSDRLSYEKARRVTNSAWYVHIK